MLNFLGSLIYFPCMYIMIPETPAISHNSVMKKPDNKMLCKLLKVKANM